MTRALTTFVVLLTVASHTHAELSELLNVDFNSGGFVAGSPTYSGAGVLGGAGDTWNGVLLSPFLPPVSGVPLVSASNTATGVTLSYTGLSAFDSSTSGVVNPFVAPELELMGDYARANTGQVSTVTLDGLTPNAGYELILYSAADVPRTTQFTVNGVMQTVFFDDVTNTFVEGVTYTRYVSMADGTGQLVIDFENGDPTQLFPEGALNGFQIQPLVNVPEPATATTLGLMGLVTLGLAARRRVV